MNLIVNVHMI